MYEGEDPRADHSLIIGRRSGHGEEGGGNGMERGVLDGIMAKIGDAVGR